MINKLKQSFAYAFRGVWYTITNERNMKIHLIFALTTIVLGIIYEIALWKWAALFLTISMVLVAETINTAIEACVDAWCQSFNPMAQRAKDAAAGAVLIAAVMAVLIGIIIFFV